MLRPVVSLKTDVIVDGDGVIENSLRYYVGTELVYDGNDFQILTEENKDSGDHFFVIADDGDSVRLISKYCLKKDALEQTDKNSSYLDTENGYGQVFSTDNYWKNISGIEYPYPLDQKDPPDEATAIKQAIAYGNSMGVRGRLLEYDEVTELNSMTNREVVNKILVGNWTDGTAPDDGMIFYWISAAHSQEGVETYNRVVAVSRYENYNSLVYGVRPVLEIPKKLK